MPSTARTAPKLRCTSRRSMAAADPCSPTTRGVYGDSPDRALARLCPTSGAVHLRATPRASPLWRLHDRQPYRPNAADWTESNMKAGGCATGLLRVQRADPRPADSPGVRLAHPEEDDEPGGGGQRPDRGNRERHADPVRQHAGDDRARGEPEVPPQPVDADGSAAP